MAAVLYRIEPRMAVGSKESCKLVGAAQGIAATESHLIPNLSAKGFKEGDCEESVRILFQEIGVDPLVHEVDLDPEGREMERALTRMGCTAPLPAVFVGGKLLGSTNEVMSLHLSGSLNQMLKPYQSQT
ncbi:hypothetical protein NC652_033411 [Populus alba x Populus x berolinensis]|nr:hypothetical protein NC652_033411 [Populus alba x Populus x berolinensis]